MKKTESIKKKLKMETSKKLAWLSGGCFAVSVGYSIAMFTYCTISNIMCDFTLPMTLVTVTGAAFGTTCAFYNNKARYENVTKIQRSFLKIKYLMLKDIGSFNEYRVQSELEEELAKIDADIENEKMTTNQENIYNG